VNGEWLRKEAEEYCEQFLQVGPGVVEHALEDRNERIGRALAIAVRYGGFDGDHHKAWALDQIVRALLGCPLETKEGADSRGTKYNYETQVANAEYVELVRQACDGEDGPDTYSWDEGVPP